MSRYTYITSNGYKLELDDWMMTDNGIEGVQIVDDKVVLVLILTDGSIMFDYESGKSKDDMAKARQAYQDMANRQQEQFKERANQIIREAVASGEVTLDADGEVDDESEGPMIELPPLDKIPPGYA